MAAKRQIDLAGLPASLESVPGLNRLQSAAEGAPAYLVGGTVRDLLLGGSRADLDVAVEGDVAPLAEALGGRLTEHERFQTAKVELDDLTIDLARTRAESYAEPGALPDIRPASLQDDLARRDFTVNAMAVPLGGDPELIDPHGGAGDLESGLLRVLHQDSFRDDPTRALRAARYAARFDLELEPGTASLLAQADLSTVSEDRVVAELQRIAAEEDPARALELIREWDLMPEIDPEGPERARRVAELVSESPWAGWVDRADAVMVAAARPPDTAVELAGATPERPSQAVALARGHHPVELVVARALGAEWLDRYASEWRQVELEIDGRELMKAGIEEGPDVGRGLEAALSAKLDGEISGRNEELEVALEVARGEIPED